MGGATLSTSRTVILSKSTHSDHDVDCLFDQVLTGEPFVDRSGNCGNFLTAIGSFATNNGLINANRVPQNGVAIIRIWQANIGKTIIAYAPITNGVVQETGDFELDGVTFSMAEVQLEFLSPAVEEDGGRGGAIFPTGNLVDNLEVPGVDMLKTTMINVGIPTIFTNAEIISYTGTELQDAINSDAKALVMFETVHAYGVVRTRLIKSIEEAATRQHTPKMAFVAPPKDYMASSDKKVGASDVDLLVRALSMSKLHYAMVSTVAVATGTAAAIPGTLINLTVGSGKRDAMRFRHLSGTPHVGMEVKLIDGEWTVTKAIMNRSARVLMEGWVRAPG